MAGNLLVSQLSSLGLVVLLVQVSKRFDLTDPSVIVKLRCLYYTLQVLNLAICLAIRYLIVRKNDQTPVSQTPTPSPFSSGGAAARLPATIVPAKDYDLAEVRKMIQQTVLYSVIMTVLHFKFGFVQPLLFQSIPPFKQLLEAPLTRIYLYGREATGDLKRPFKAPNPFEALMNPSSEEQAPAPPAATSTPAAKEVEELSDSEGSSVEEQEPAVGNVRSRAFTKKSRKDL